ncbi:MAG: copper resistance CopC family protein [Lapillicoccus sp.]
MRPTRGRGGAIHRRLVTLAVVCLLAVGAVVAAAPAAVAHDVLVSTDPASGATVATTPDAVVLTFDRPALGIGTTIRVIGAAGDVQSGPPRLVDTTVTQDLVGGAPAGSYRVAWRATSADGHPVSGEFSFTAAAANPRAPQQVPSTSATSTSAASVGASATSGSSPAGLIVALVLALVLVGGAALGLRRWVAARR